MRKAHSSGK